MEEMRLVIAESEARLEERLKQDRIVKKLLVAAQSRIKINEGILDSHSQLISNNQAVLGEHRELIDKNAEKIEDVR